MKKHLAVLFIVSSLLAAAQTIGNGVSIGTGVRVGLPVLVADCGAGTNGVAVDNSTCGVTATPYAVETPSNQAGWQSGATQITTCATTISGGADAAHIKHYYLANDITPAGGNGTQCLTWAFSNWVQIDLNGHRINGWIDINSGGQGLHFFNGSMRCNQGDSVHVGCILHTSVGGAGDVGIWYHDLDIVNLAVDVNRRNLAIDVDPVFFTGLNCPASPISATFPAPNHTTSSSVKLCVAVFHNKFDNTTDSCLACSRVYSGPIVQGNSPFEIAYNDIHLSPSDAVQGPSVFNTESYIHHNKIVEETTIFNLAVTHVKVLSNVVTLTFSGPAANVFNGMQTVLSFGTLSTSQWLNGQTVTINQTATNTHTIQFPFTHANTDINDTGLIGSTGESARAIGCDSNFIPLLDKGCYQYNNDIIANNNRALRYRSRQGRSFYNRLENASFFAIHLGDQNGQPAAITNGQVVIDTIARASGVATLTCKTTGGVAAQCLPAGSQTTALVQHVKNNGGDYTFDGLWTVLSSTSGSLTLSQPNGANFSVVTLTNSQHDPALGDANVGIPNYYANGTSLPANNSIVFEDYSSGIGAEVDHNTIVNPLSTLTVATIRGSGWLIDHNTLEGPAIAALFADFGGDGGCAWCTGNATFRNNDVMVASGNNITIGASGVFPPIAISSISSNGTVATMVCALACMNDGASNTTAFNAGRQVYINGTSTAFDGQVLTVRNATDATHVFLNTSVANGVSAVTGFVNTYYSIAVCNSGNAGLDSSHPTAQIGEITVPGSCP